WTADVAPLRDAVQAHRDALAAVPRGHPDLAGHLFNLGNALQMLGQRAKDRSILAEAAATHREGIAVSPADHPDHARGQFCLAAALEALSEYNNGGGLLAEARTCYQRAAENPAGRAPERIKAYYKV